MEEEPSDSEGGASEVENVASGEEGVTVTESEEKEKQIEEERKEVEPAMSQSTSAVLDSTSCKYCGSAEQLCIRGSTPVKPTKSCFLPSILITFYFLLFSVFRKISLVQFQYRPSQHQTLTDFNQCDHKCVRTPDSVIMSPKQTFQWTVKCEADISDGTVCC